MLGPLDFLLPVYNQSLYSMEILCHNIYSAGHTLNKRRCRESIFHEQTKRVRSKKGGLLEMHRKPRRSRNMSSAPRFFFPLIIFALQSGLGKYRFR